MTILQAIRAANRDGDYPTTMDLADGLGRSPRNTSAVIAYLHRLGRITAAGEVKARGPFRASTRIQWRATNATGKRA